MTAGIHVYRTKRLEAEAASRDGAHWCTITYSDGLNNTVFRVTSFFEDAETARAYADAINSVGSEPAEDADGWIPWHGGYCPVSDGTRVDVRLRTGREYFGLAASPGSIAAEAYWHHDDHRNDIIAYRIARPSRSEAAE